MLCCTLYVSLLILCEEKVANIISSSGVEMKLKHAKYPTIICATHVLELERFHVGQTDIECGSGMTLTAFDDKLKSLIMEGMRKAKC